MKEIIIAIVSGLCVAIPSVFATIMTNSKNNALQDERIQMINTNISTLTAKVEQHNNFGLQLADLKARVENLERK